MTSYYGPDLDICWQHWFSHEDVMIWKPWWRHQMETFSALLALCAWNSLVTGEFPSQRPVTQSFDFCLIYAWTNGWVNNRETGDLRRHRAHYDVIVLAVRITDPLWWEPIGYRWIPLINGPWCEAWMLITRNSEVIMFSPCVFICVCLCLSRCLFGRINYEGMLPHKQYFAGT